MWNLKLTADVPSKRNRPTPGNEGKLGRARGSLVKAQDADRGDARVGREDAGVQGGARGASIRGRGVAPHPDIEGLRGKVCK